MCSLKSLLLGVAVFSYSVLGAENSPFKQAIEEIKSGKYVGIDGMLYYQNGDLVAEHYFNGFNQDSLHQTRSTFKSITGLLAAIAFDKKLLLPSESIGPLISKFTSVNVIDKKKYQVKVGDLLHMTSSLACSEMPGKGPFHEDMVDNGPEPLKYSLSINMLDNPGTTWRYCNANSFLLGVVISAALKRAGLPDIFQFADTHLFAPLNITNYQIYKSPDGYLYGQGNARFLPRDLAKLGLLVLNDGKWRGQQIISAKRVQALKHSPVNTQWTWFDTVKAHPNNISLYGYQWFTSQFDIQENRYLVHHTWGNGGQFVFVIPALNSVYVFTGSNYGDIEKQKQPFQLMVQLLNKRLNQRS